MRIERSAPEQFIYNSSSGGFISTIGNNNKETEWIRQQQQQQHNITQRTSVEKNTHTHTHWMNAKKSANHWHTVILCDIYLTVELIFSPLSGKECRAKYTHAYISLHLNRSRMILCGVACCLCASETHQRNIMCVCVSVANAAEKRIPAINHVGDITINKAVCLAILFFLYIFFCGELSMNETDSNRYSTFLLLWLILCVNKSH